MHIILGMLGTIVTILILLNRLADAGIDIGWLNPFLWRRRRAWKKQCDGEPIYKLSEPIDVTAILMVAVVKTDGDMTSEEKREILNLFENTFNLSKSEASNLMVSSVHLLKDGCELRSNLKRFLAPSLNNFSSSQRDSAISLIKQVSKINDEYNPNKIDLVDKIIKLLKVHKQNSKEW